MSVVAFERKQTAGSWSEAELDTIVAALNVALAPGTGREWETGITEIGDPQFYLLSPLPDQACELSVSRIGGRYILEDGSGRLLFEHRNLALVAMHAKAAARSASWRLVAHVVLLWCTVRQILHDKVEPWLAEGEELLVDLAPQLITFA
jgi:hypothetical protein